MTLLPLTFTMLKIVLIASVLYLAQAQNTDHTHPTHPTHPPNHQGSPPPHGVFGFHYERDAGEMVMVSQSHCYLMALSDAQKMNLHDPVKIEALEFQLVALASDTTKQTVLTGTQSPGNWITGHCHNKIVVQVAA
ncbi:uncharacterized protein LOC124136764 [Haliotis rufescens]|uniref:uncharacterized protein LOC124136764 n=1 Tax=Haliotis rufescens TaxID=6454 RepID=UPI001EB0A051|nr:uncharacterized protein LOC124136764 [Haliotis rufescens]